MISFTFRITDPRDGVSNAPKVSIKIKSADNTPANGMIDRPVQNIPTKSDNKTTFIPSENRNHRPSADAGPDHAVNEATTVDLVGSGKDKDRDKLSYSWKQILGPTVELKGVDKPTSIFDVPDIDRDTLLQFSLTVDDGRGGQDTDTARILVKNQDVTEVNSSIESGSKNNQTEQIELKR